MSLIIWDRRDTDWGERCVDSYFGKSLNILFVQGGKTLFHQPHVIVSGKGLAVFVHQVPQLCRVVARIDLC